MHVVTWLWVLLARLHFCFLLPSLMKSDFGHITRLFVSFCMRRECWCPLYRVFWRIFEFRKIKNTSVLGSLYWCSLYFLFFTIFTGWFYNPPFVTQNWTPQKMKDEINVPFYRAGSSDALSMLFSVPLSLVAFIFRFLCFRAVLIKD